MASNFEEKDDKSIKKEGEGDLIQIDDTTSVPMTTKKLFSRNNDFLKEDETYSVVSPSYNERMRKMQEGVNALDRLCVEVNALNRQITLEELGLDSELEDSEVNQKRVLNDPVVSKIIRDQCLKYKRRHLKKLRSKSYEQTPPKILKRGTVNVPSSWHSTPKSNGSRPQERLSESTIFGDDDDDDDDDD